MTPSPSPAPAPGVGPPRPREGTIGVVEDLRGIAALAVGLFHLGMALPEGAARSVLAHGWVGVEAFFVISGFVMPLSLLRADYRVAQFPRFVAKRVVRLDPPYLACIALILALDLAATLAPWSRGLRIPWDPARLSSHLLYLTGFLSMEWLCPIFWTLALEFQYYLALGILFPLLGRTSTLGLVPVLAVCLAGPFLAEGKVTVLPYLPLFGMGFVAFRWHAGKDPLPVLAGLGVLLAGVTGPMLGWEVAAVGLATAVLIVAVRGPTRRCGWLGTISYSFYLVHLPVGGLVLSLGKRFAGSDGARWPVFLAALAASLAVAGAFYRVVELPARRWASRIGYRPEAAKPA